MSMDTVLSLQDRLRQSLKPLGGQLRIDRFIPLMVRERATRAAAEKAAAVAAQQEARKDEAQPQAASENTEPSPDPMGGGVQEFLQQDQVSESDQNEVTDFMKFLGDSGMGADAEDE